MIRRHFSTTFVVKCLSFAGSLVQGIFLTRLLGPEGKGILSYLQANTAFLGLLLGFTLPMGLNFFLASRKIPREKLMGLAATFTAFSLAGLSLLMALAYFVPAVNFFLPEKHFTLFFAAYLWFSFLFNFISNIYYSVFAGLSLFYTLSGLEALITIAKIVTFALLYFRSPSAIQNWPLLFSLDLSFSFLQFLSYFLLGHFQAKLRFDFRLQWGEDFVPLFKYILPLYWTNLITFLYTRVDLWIIERLLGLAQLGVYSIAVGAAQLLTFFPVAINTVLYTYLAKSESPEREKIFADLSKLNLVLVSAGALFLVFASDWLVPLLYGKDFAGASGPLKILAWAYMLSSVKFLFILYNQISIRLRDNVISELVVLMISVILNFVLIPSMGILGAALSIVAANLLALVFLLQRIHRNSELSMARCFFVTRRDFQRLWSLSHTPDVNPPEAG